MKNDGESIRLHEKNILTLKIINKQLQKKINKNNTEIEKLRKYNRELKGRN
ncbi:flavodoxin [Haloimpatiens sp. FM7315]|uniref:flavodoxin n=1 Tax=Haloimpatiens sp. FM7315 TaxID=3298609 RepID=UPI0035A3BD7F